MPGRFHETVRFHETAVAAKAVRGVKAHFRAAERFHAAVAKTDARCAQARTHAVARIRVLAADRTGAVAPREWAIRCVMGDQHGLVIRCAMDDLRFGLAPGPNVENRQLRATERYVPPGHDFHHWPAALGRESVRPVDSQSNAMACPCE